MSIKPQFRLLLAATAISASVSSYAQPQNTPDSNIVVNGVPASPPPPAALPQAAPNTVGPEIRGVITARNGKKMKVEAADGSSTIVALDDATRIKSGGLFSNGAKLTPDSLLNGLPVTVKTSKTIEVHGGGELVARQVSLKINDLKTARMIHNGTAQRFDEQTAATEALRGRMGDIDKYNIKGTTNVHFDTGESALSTQDKTELCATAASAQATENALMLVVGYTDSTGGDDFNQQLSEKRAARVINYLQQACNWKPYRMLTPTGMAKADPLADNNTAEGKAQNRRVAVNILVSKSVDGM